MKVTLDSVRAVARSRWTVPVLLVLAAVALAGKLDAGRRAEARARRLADAEVLRLQDVAVAAEAREAKLKADLKGAVALVSSLEGELKRVNAAARGARVVLVSKGSTGPVLAGGLPRAPEERGHAAEAGEQAGGAGPQRHDPTAAERPSSPACLLVAGDRTEIRAAVSGLETRAGNVVVVGAAEAWRISAPATRLFGAPLRLDTSISERDAGRGAGAGWGGGARLVLGRSGVLFGPAGSPPPWRVWRAQLEVHVDVAVEIGNPPPDRGRDWYLGASALVRRWR